MAAHTVASVAGRTLVLERETVLQDARIAACESSTASLLQSMARVETNMKAVVRSTNGAKEPPPPKTIALRRLAESAVGTVVVVVAIAVVILIIAGRLDADDIANILRAWKSGN